MKAMPERKNNRLEGYDYSQAGCYFITICTLDKLPLFSRISIMDAALGAPNTELTTIGLTVQKYIENISLKNENVILNNYVVMPNHVHLIITIRSGTPRAASPTKSTISKIVNAFKSLSTKACGKPIWQRGYYDHIIRDDNDYEMKYKYIETNPVRWATDKYYMSVP